MVRLVIAAVVTAVVAAAAAHAGPTGAGTGVIRGTVIFDGSPPERAPVRRDSDPYCARTTELAGDVIVTGGKLRDVLVRVKNGSLRAAAAAPAPAPITIDQKDCRYTPRVVGLVVGQKLAVRNSDGTFHNIHGTIAGQPLWNKPASPGDPELRLDGSAHAGDVIDIACDVHPWMHAYAVVQDHTAFAVTGDDGAFELTGLPPGRYTVEAWHPVLGTRSATVVVTRGKPAILQLAFGRDAKRE